MKSAWKLIRRFVLTLILAFIILFILNIVLFISLSANDRSNAGGWTAAEEIAAEFSQAEDGSVVLSETGRSILEKRRAWAILIDDKTGDVIWHSENLPPEIPLHYSVADVSWAVRGYIEDYPTTCSTAGDNLLLLGHPKTMYWKSLTNTWDYHTIANAPKIFLKFVGTNLFCIIVIYFVATSGVLRSVKPIVKGIEALPEGEVVYVPEKGLLSSLAAAINQSSERLRAHEHALKKKEKARENWIAGVSHDIRTPLSMVMGYAGQLEEDEELPKKARKKAEIIRFQSMRMRNLINDLNLYSKLEYNMQPVNVQEVNLVSIARRAAADFINLDMHGLYPLEWKIEDETADYRMQGDKELLARAVNNILVNAQVHNQEGCSIKMEINKKDEQLLLRISDNGAGVSDEQLEKLKNTPHYIESRENGKEQRHGLGLLIVRQITAAHHGTAEFGQGKDGRGFVVELRFPGKENE